MFAFILTALFLQQSFTHADTRHSIGTNRQICYRNSTTCLDEFQKNMVIPLVVGDLSFGNMIYYIRRYNYEMNFMLQMSNKNKRQRRKTRKMFYNKKNYKMLSHSSELDYLEHPCDIQFNKIDSNILKKIRFKIVKIKQLIESKNNNIRFFNGLIFMGLCAVLLVMFMVIFLG